MLQFFVQQKEKYIYARSNCLTLKKRKKYLSFFLSNMWPNLGQSFQIKTQLLGQKVYLISNS